MQNQRRAQKHSKTGLLGASRHECGKYVAQATVNRKKHYLGLYETAQEAHDAYMAFKKEHCK